MVFGRIIFDEYAWRLRFRGKKLHCGMKLEVAIPGIVPIWVPVEVSYNHGWIFKGLDELNPEGLIARSSDPYFLV